MTKNIHTLNPKFPFEVRWEVPENLNELLIAELSELGFDTFWESPEGLRAYCPEEPPTTLLDSLAQKYAQDGQALSYHIESTEAQSWGPAKEDHSHRFTLSDRLYVGPPEEEIPGDFAYTLYIRGALAFGNGQHPSTRLMLEALLDFPLENAKVLDIGTGTGILALLAEQKGAQSVEALDNNPWAIAIAQENLRLNHAQTIQLYQGYAQDIILSPPYDCMLANLNFHVLAQELPFYSTLLSPGGYIFLGGFQEKDQATLGQILLDNQLEKLAEKKSSPWLNWMARKR